MTASGIQTSNPLLGYSPLFEAGAGSVCCVAFRIPSPPSFFEILRMIHVQGEKGEFCNRRHDFIAVCFSTQGPDELLVCFSYMGKNKSNVGHEFFTANARRRMEMKPQCPLTFQFLTFSFIPCLPHAHTASARRHAQGRHTREQASIDTSARMDSAEEAK